MSDANAFLEEVRRREFDRIRHWFQPGSRVLELGGGNGYQASLIAATGAHVRSLDIPSRPRRDRTYWDVEDYDGAHIPAADASVDVVYTSNVLEHIRTLDLTLGEIRRVLRPGGVAIHVLPSVSWRLWTTVGHPAAVARSVMRPSPRVDDSGRLTPTKVARRSLARVLRVALVADPHGEYPSALSELWYFSRFRWTAYFAARGWTVRESFGNGLFYTGWTFMPDLPLAFRRTAARLLGSATRTFILAPTVGVTRSDHSPPPQTEASAERALVTTPGDAGS